MTFETPSRTITPSPVLLPGAAGGYPPPPSDDGQGLAIASLVSSIVFLGGLGSLAGIVLGHVSHHRSRTAGVRTSGLAVAGLVIGYLGLLGALFLIMFAIAIPTFLNQREKGYEQAMRSGLKETAVMQESFRVDGGTYTTDLGVLAPVTDPAVTVQVVVADSQYYCLMATSAETDRALYLDSASGTVSETSCS